MLSVKVKKINPDAKFPSRATEGSACYDVYSVKRFLFSPMERGRIPTGLAFELSEGYAMDIRPRSGLTTKGLIILNSPGTLDSDYRGELQIGVMNLSNGNILVSKGDRIAQIRIFQTLDIEFEETEVLNETDRGEGGFGSTGK